VKKPLSGCFTEFWTWTKSAIREARKAELVPLLLQRGYRLQPRPNDNYTVLPDPDDPTRPAGLLVKANYWIWPDRDLSGNTIDFFVHVEGQTFHHAMAIITHAPT
jgi:hypothetical protein